MKDMLLRRKNRYLHTIVRSLFAFVPIQSEEAAPMLYSLFQSPDLAQLLNRLFFTAISIGAILAVIKIMWGGYTYMASNLWTSKDSAKKTIQNAVIGLLILLSVYLILYQINPCLLNLDILTSVESGVSNCSPQNR